MCLEGWKNRTHKLKMARVNPPSRSASADEKMWFNSPTLGSEKGVQGLPWGLIPFIKIVKTSCVTKTILFKVGIFKSQP